MVEELKALLCSLEERLAQHDANREKVQAKLQEACSDILEDADSLEKKIGEEVHKDFSKKEEAVLALIVKLESGEYPNLNSLIEQARKEMSVEQRYEISHKVKREYYVDSYNLRILYAEVRKESEFDNTGDNEDATRRIETITKSLREHLARISESKVAVLDELSWVCTVRRNEAGSLKAEINDKLEKHFCREDARLQEVVSAIRGNIASRNLEEVKALGERARLALLINTKYALKKPYRRRPHDLEVTNEVSLEFIRFEERKPTNVTVSFTSKTDVSLSFAFFIEDEMNVLNPIHTEFTIEIRLWKKDKRDNVETFVVNYTLGDDELPIHFEAAFVENTAYCLKMRIVHQKACTKWSDKVEFTSTEFK